MENNSVKSANGEVGQTADVKFCRNWWAYVLVALLGYIKVNFYVYFNCSQYLDYMQLCVIMYSLNI